MKRQPVDRHRAQCQQITYRRQTYNLHTADNVRADTRQQAARQQTSSLAESRRLYSRQQINSIQLTKNRQIQRDSKQKTVSKQTGNRQRAGCTVRQKADSQAGRRRVADRMQTDSLQKTVRLILENLGTQKENRQQEKMYQIDSKKTAVIQYTGIHQTENRHITEVQTVGKKNTDSKKTVNSL